MPSELIKQHIILNQCRYSTSLHISLQYWWTMPVIHQQIVETYHSPEEICLSLLLFGLLDYVLLNRVIDTQSSATTLI